MNGSSSRAPAVHAHARLLRLSLLSLALLDLLLLGVAGLVHAPLRGRVLPSPTWVVEEAAVRVSRHRRRPDGEGQERQHEIASKDCCLALRRGDGVGVLGWTRFRCEGFEIGGRRAGAGKPASRRRPGHRASQSKASKGGRAGDPWLGSSGVQGEAKAAAVAPGRMANETAAHAVTRLGASPDR